MVSVNRSRSAPKCYKASRCSELVLDFDKFCLYPLQFADNFEGVEGFLAVFVFSASPQPHLNSPLNP